MNVLPYKSCLDDHDDIEKNSSLPEESGIWTAQSDATIVATNHYSGTKPISLISTIQQQKEARVNSTNDGSNAYCPNNPNVTNLLFQESNKEWNQQYKQQLSSDFCPSVNRDYSDNNSTTPYNNISNSHMWGQEQSIIDLFVSNDKTLSSGPHQQPLSVPEDNHFEKEHGLMRVTTEAPKNEWPLYLNNSSSSNYNNDNTQHQPQQLIIDTSLLSTKTSNEWKLLQQHDWIQQIENHNNNQRFSSSLDQQLCYPCHDVEYPLSSSSGESSTSQQWSTIENGSYPSSSRTSLSSSLQQRPEIALQCNSVSLLSTAHMNTRIDSNNRNSNDTNINHCFSTERSQLSSISSSLSSTSSIRPNAKKNVYVCFFGTCCKKFGRRSDLPRHIRSVHDQLNQKIQYQCHACRKYLECVRHDMIKRHVNNTCLVKKKEVSSPRQHCSKVSIDEDNNKNNNGYTIIKEPSFYCCCFDKCDQTFPIVPDYENHILTHDKINKKYGITGYCDSCGEIKCYTRAQALEQHFKNCNTK